MRAEEARINTANADSRRQMDLIIVSKQFWMLDCFLPPTISTSGLQKDTQKHNSIVMFLEGIRQHYLFKFYI